MDNITGFKFNGLTALKPLFKYRRQWTWLCKCVCGKETNVLISKLKNNTTKSCGCFKAINIQPKFGSKHRGWEGYMDVSKSFFSRIKQTAIQRKIEFSITMEDLWVLFQSQQGLCAYTGKPIFLPINVRQLRGENNENIASLDRIDNDKGYVLGNLQWVCKRVNYMKHTMQDEYFLEWIDLIYKHKVLNRI